ncbi:dephospho-CoA kinase [Campylobacter insulaenigrae]|uniref:Dephospho-CoA kinase n=1 Tax=Campylobacter insulaenigrae NCTC 12927 TaxID=1031564 RepID=A0A0A8H2H0_9BACT|nr:dephospho-CoA kinase [Campylobacter insulaenigrae]AJC87064.1 dephospho-CoA kinase [Campylobacter insulaenigrae NCTC 12927]MCR6570601.1 dephospho-CoA kinase [Campylobacter insulaenigrae]MCR6572251.1 dephospho-CoA kinase [Campylobacter insulaenigrae]MCR6576622.1 dephospho-CoA kinase [Campylobacter insulaenigrae]MCR6578547.1 dephospho-CoA kinase [Campylobacter insulaenigrae]
MQNAYFVTSSIAGGKSTFIKIVKKLGFDTISADEITHMLLNENAQHIAKLFDDFSLIVNNGIDRKKLGNIIFNDVLAKSKLENFIHPKIKKEILSQAIKIDKKNKAFFIELPLFFENNNYQNLGKSILIYAPKKLLLQRLMKREHIDKEEALKRINCQLDIEKKKQIADYVIENIESYEIFEESVLNFLKYNLKVII